jgi:hypothetical protein
MEWTSNMPTEAGWYWIKANGMSPTVMQIFSRQEALCWSNHISKKVERLDTISQGLSGIKWAGPIPQPDE